MSLTALHTYLEHVTALKRLPRTGWLLAGVVPCESVADHTGATALLALGLAQAINADWAAEELLAPLDVGKTVQIALVHDLAESVLTDLPRRSAELLGGDVKHAAEARALEEQVLRGLPDAANLLALWADYDRAGSPEARLVRDADKLEMVHQALVYARRGPGLDEFWEGHRWHYRLTAALFGTLRQLRG